jgi:hypothetical protein
MDKQYIQNEFNKLVQNDNIYKYQFSIYDGYGNKTKFLSVNNIQLEQIKQILIKHEQTNI